MSPARIRRSISRISTLAGFGATVLFLAIASLAAIPAMINSAGNDGWAAIALGQALGAIGAVALAYGWGLTGPAKIARAEVSVRRAEYFDSVRVKALLVAPVCGLAAVAAAYLEQAHALLAAAGAIQAATIGLTGNWYFVGTARPYAMLTVETLPRVAGTVVAIVAMTRGASATTGLLWMIGGTVIGFAAVTLYVVVSTAAGRHVSATRRGLTTILRAQRHGLSSHLLGTVYLAAPIVLVSALAPASQPVFALADKIIRQFTAALAPAVTVLQGWVPRADAASVVRRARIALVATVAAAALMAAAILVVAPLLVAWLSDGQMTMPRAMVALMTACIVVYFVESVIARAVLASFDRLRIVALATLISALTALPLVAIGAAQFGAVGALGAVLSGLVIRTGIELVACLRVAGKPEPTTAGLVSAGKD